MADETIEVQARAMGWVPKEEFKGDTDKWKSAEDFVKDGYEILPILRERTKKLSTKFDEVTQKLASTESTLQKLTEHHKKVDQRAYDRAVAELKEQQRKAVENSDMAAYEAIDARKVYEDELEDINQKVFHEPKGCKCGEVLRGLVDPLDCPLFSTECTPTHPIGPCMVSVEGSCNIQHKYQKHGSISV